jgi:hypothetical protein
MTESSRYWNTNNVGDGPTAGFDRDAVAGWLRNIWARGGSGVLRGVLNELAATGTASPIAVNTGAAIVYGLYYWNTASVNLTVTTPSVGTTGGRVILRASWSAQTVRLVAVRNTDGVAAIPSLTQTPGTTYEISLATFTITTGGVISLTDDRSYAAFSDSPGADAINALDGLSVLGRAANTTGVAAAITAATNGYALRRSGTAIGFGQIAAAGIANDAITAAKIADAAVGAAQISAGAVGSDELADGAIDDTKLGNRVPQFYRRQGGHASNWATAGTTEYTPGEIMMQAGIIDGGMLTGVLSDLIVLTFPVSFSATPIILLQLASPSSTSIQIYTRVDLLTASSFYIEIQRLSSSGALTFNVQWLAIGPV